MIHLTTFEVSNSFVVAGTGAKIGLSLKLNYEFKLCLSKSMKHSVEWSSFSLGTDCLFVNDVVEHIAIMTILTQMPTCLSSDMTSSQFHQRFLPTFFVQKLHFGSFF